MATRALNSGLWVRRLLMGGSPHEERYPSSEVTDGACPEKPVQLTPPLAGPTAQLNEPDQDEHWQPEGRRMFSAESMAAIPSLEELPAQPSLQDSTA
jgi:hypothetical protein